MKITIDSMDKKLIVGEKGKKKEFNLYSKEAFEILSREWIRIGWNLKYPYTFTWLGRPIIQLPEDMVRIQEVIFQVRPDVIIETGVAHGGSLIYYASLCKILNKGRVIGIDIEIRPNNRQAIESHPLSSYITLIEGSSTDPVIVSSVQSMIQTGETVFVILDSCHTNAHVAEELRLYSPLVSSGSYIIATDGIMKELADLPHGREEWTHDNPSDAAIEFALHHKEFTLGQPVWLFNESPLSFNITHWPNAYLRKK